LKVLLIVPPNSVADRKPLGKFTLSTSPLGLSYIAAVLEANGFSVSILDLSFPTMEMERLKEKIAQFEPDIVGVSTMTSNFPSAVLVAKKAKLWNPASIVVMGGIHATFLHRDILKTVPEVDFVVRYEGEYTMSELVDALDKKGFVENVKGISYREKGQLVSTPFRSRIEDLDGLPYPAHHLLEPSFEEYISYYGKRNFPIMTTRGCPFGCIYCSTMAFHGRKYRTRSIPNVIGELRYLIERFKADNISFADDNFTLQKDRVFSLCEEIRKENLSIEWGCSARVDQVSEELLKAMKSAGCTDIFFGIESTSQRVLDIVRKRFTVKQAKDAVKTAEKLGIRTHCSFVLGLPGESERSLNNIVSFLEETKPSGRVLPNLLQILPGTELSENTEKFFRNRASISDADKTKAQLEILARFYQLNYGLTELFRIPPPEVVFE